MKPKSLGLVAALVVVPTVAAVVPGPFAGAVSRVASPRTSSLRVSSARVTSPTIASPRVTYSSTSSHPAVDTARLVSVHVTTGVDATMRQGARSFAACTSDGPGTDAYSLTGARVTSSAFHLNPAGAPVSGAATVFQTAFATWKAASANAPAISVFSDSAVRKPTADNVNELMFKPLKGRTIAITYTWQHGSGAYEDDVVFNTNVPWFVAPSEGTGCYGINAYDLQDAATHEFGHVYGLGHVQSQFNTMYPTVTTGETYKRSLAPGDAAGIRAVYGG